MVCCALIAFLITGALYLVRAIVPGLSNANLSRALSWRPSEATGAAATGDFIYD